MTTVYDVPPGDLIKRAAQKLKESKKIEPPSWAPYVKTGAHKELQPSDNDWWYVRCASILRRIYIDGPVGVSRLRAFYGGKHRSGVTPPVFSKGSGSIPRTALQQLEKAGYVRSSKSGRVISQEGRSFLDNVAHEIKGELSKQNISLAKY